MKKIKKIFRSASKHVRNHNFWYGGVALLVIALVFTGYYFKQYSVLRTQSNIAIGEGCQNKEEAAQTQCYLQNIERILKAKGVNEALNQVSTIAATDSNFFPLCHDFMHRVGQVAFLQFSGHRSFDVSSKITICSYGFYHGFMEALLQTTGSYEQARDFCSYIDGKLQSQGLDISSECYHGIGHGGIATHDSSLSGDADKLTQQGLDLCDHAAETDEQKLQCAGGVFNGIANAISGSEYGLSINDQAPLALCGKQKDFFKPVCYGFMGRVLLRLTGSNLAQAVAAAEQQVGEEERKNVVVNIAVVYSGTVSGKEPLSYLAACRELEARWFDTCVQGAAIGLLQTGSPGNEYSRPFLLCQSSQLTVKQSSDCLQVLYPELYKLYGKEKFYSLCGMLLKNYSDTCLAFQKTAGQT